MTNLNLIRGRLSRDDAEQVVARACGGAVANVDGELFYPYHYFLLRVSWRTLLGRDGGKVPCLVDARMGGVSTADSFTIEYVSVDSASALPTRVSEPEAERMARRAAALAAQRRQRALSVPSWEVLERGRVYKRFWLVSLGDGDATRLIVDGVTGGFHPL